MSNRYFETAERRLQALLKRRSATVLAIETSCDETAAAVVRDGRAVLSNAVHTQIPLHAPYGGVVPEIASRNHVEMIGPVVARALFEAKLPLAQIDAVAVTYGPGLVGALLVGLSYAKGLAFAAGLPFLGVNHIASHIAANYLSSPELVPPFTCLVASGGHSHIIRVEGYDRYALIGRTRDDAAGEAFDKVARVLGLGYPGGPNLEKLAAGGDPSAVRFHSAFNEGAGYDFSFSGVKTAVVNHIHSAGQRGETINKADVAASFQATVVEVLAGKAVRAALEQAAHGDCPPVLALAGGVSANRALRQALQTRCDKNGVRFYCPEFCYCTDNAAMVGSAAYYRLMAGHMDPLSLNAVPNLSIAQERAQAF